MSREAMQAALKILARQLAGEDDDCGDPDCDECNAIRRPLARVVGLLRAALAQPEAQDAARYRHLRQHYLRSCAHPLGDAIGMDEVIFGDDADAAIDADIERRALRYPHDDMGTPT